MRTPFEIENVTIVVGGYILFASRFRHHYTLPALPWFCKTLYTKMHSNDIQMIFNTEHSQLLLQAIKVFQVKIVFYERF